jgi:hypothetical protein
LQDDSHTYDAKTELLETHYVMSVSPKRVIESVITSADHSSLHIVYVDIA